MRVKDFEDKFYLIEGMVIILRCDPNLDIGEYDYDRAAPGDMTLAEFKAERLSFLTVPYVIHDGDVEQPHGRALLSAIRGSYKQKQIGLTCG